ncbi:hypothetical protein [Streptomyces sp. ISL-100]|uniref:hypothetical protein n=1 Tax=Streptomyces sp. ISL-100 TaxID=2819173 RepID=UPI001BE83F5E|nr:hypothetical protein [Streptomyces sp. ISL-100]MBT2396641.1 hypothetical protein [Streptomyces sp. ISL-100]
MRITPIGARLASDGLRQHLSTAPTTVAAACKPFGVSCISSSECLVPVTPPSGFYAWVQCGEAVVSTSLPVRETYVEVHRSGRD